MLSYLEKYCLQRKTFNYKVAQNLILNNFVIENFSLKSLVLKILVMVTDGRTYGRTDGRTYGRTDRPSYRDARTHLKKTNNNLLRHGEGALGLNQNDSMVRTTPRLTRTSILRRKS